MVSGQCDMVGWWLVVGCLWFNDLDLIGGRISVIVLDGGPLFPEQLIIGWFFIRSAVGGSSG